MAASRALQKESARSGLLPQQRSELIGVTPTAGGAEYETPAGFSALYRQAVAALEREREACAADREQIIAALRRALTALDPAQEMPDGQGDDYRSRWAQTEICAALQMLERAR